MCLFCVLSLMHCWSVSFTNPVFYSHCFESVCACLGIQGHEVYIDENGDAEANFTVLALRPDTGIYGYAMRPIGRFLRDTLDRHNLVGIFF